MHANHDFLDLVKAYETIVVFRHVNPDGDALGSQLGMVSWLQLNFPEKNIYAVGSNDHHYSIYQPMDEVDLEGVTYLSIVVDTANRPRIDDQRYLGGAKIIKIDHHIEVDLYGDLQIVDTDRGSACEIVTDLLRAFDLKFDARIARFLLSGILTDTIRFSIEKTSSLTLDSASFLMQKGASINDLNNALFMQEKAIFETKALIMNQVQVKEKLSYVILDLEALKHFPVESKGVKAQVNCMSGVRDFEIWTIIVQDEDGTYEASLRSRTNSINDIAETYGGGGHRLASGISKLSRDDVKTLIETLSQRSIENYTQV